MNKSKEISSKKIYIIFLLLLVVISILYLVFVVVISYKSIGNLILVSTIFISLIFIIGIIFILTIRKKVRQIVSLLDNMIDSAINEEGMINEYDETILSSLENKLLKYIQITKSNKEIIENERNKVKTLVADISHQTKTPISNILLYRQLAIFYISIVRDIKFYGLLKTIGTTKKQINKIIIKQALSLSLIGIPIGLIIGYGVGASLMPIIMRILNIEYTKVSMSPIILIGSVTFSVITVLISTYKPAKVASKVSPIEAIRYSGVSKSSKKKFKKTSNGAKINKMALSNIFKNKKKAMVVIMSLSLSIILLNIVYTMISGFNMDKYLSDLIGTDFTIGDASFYRWNFDSNNLNAITDELCERIEAIDGVKTIDKIYHRNLQIPLNDTMKNNLKNLNDNGDEYLKESIARTKETNLINCMYYGIDKGVYKLLDKYIIEGELDVEKFESGNYIIAEKEWMDTSIVKLGVGDKVTIPFEKGEDK